VSYVVGADIADTVITMFKDMTLVEQI
jgi:hypothetical protein